MPTALELIRARREDIAAIINDQFVWSYTLFATTIAAGVRRDLTLVTEVEWVTKQHSNSADADILLKASLTGGEIVIADPTNGEIVITIPASSMQTAFSGCERVSYSVVLIFADADERETIAYGDLFTVNTARDEP